VRASDVARQLLTFSRGESTIGAAVDVSGMANETLSLLRATTPTSITINADANTKLTAQFNSAQLQQVLVNLCLNARDALVDYGTRSTSRSGERMSTRCVLRAGRCLTETSQGSRLVTTS
jgi:C4-dicarboxylate-specific signal transduction histidine kinase